MSREFVWGCELNKTQREYIWCPETEDDDESIENHALILKQAMLGATDDSVRGDVNIVEIETEGYNGNEIKFPVFRMTAGTNDYIQLDMYVPKYCTLKLISGSGPVFITGQHIIELFSDDESEESIEKEEHLENQECESDTEIEPEPEPVLEKVKRKLENGKGNPKKLVKLDYSDKEKDDEEEDQEEEDSIKESPPKNVKRSTRAKGKATTERIQKKKK